MGQTAPDCKLSGPPPYNCEGCDLSNVNLAGKDLKHANLKHTTLRGTLFKGATGMDGADMSGAVMGDGTDFSGCDLTNVTFSATPSFGSNPDKPTLLVGATLRYQTLGNSWNCVDLTNAKILGLPVDLSMLNVSQCRLSGIDLKDKTLKNAHFSQTDLTGADFSGGTLDNIVFSGQCDLTGAKFCRARISSGVFDTATLTKVDFSGAITLADSTFLNALMDGTIFDRTDLTNCTFSSPPSFSRDPKNLTTFRAATLNYSTIQKVWSYLALADAKLVGLDPSVDLTYLEAKYADLTGLKLSGYTLNYSNFSGATLTNTQFQGAKMSHAVLRGAQGTQPRFDGATLDNADFSPAKKGVRTSLRGAVFNDATLTPNVDLSLADLSLANVKDRATRSQFQRAKMNGAALSQADLTGADLTGGVLLHGANLSNITLKDADLTGAQLGAYSELFSVPTQSGDYTPFLNALLALSPTGVSSIIRKYHYQIAPERTTVENKVPGRSWIVTDNSPQADSRYMVLKWSAKDGSTKLIVSRPTKGASLSSAYMPNAVLVDADLREVDASHAQIYHTGPNTGGMNGAILDGITLADANLGTLDLTDAKLHNAVMTNVNLINAKLNRAVLSNASLDNANLAGADFTDATLDEANLSNSAVSTSLNPTTAGVHLFTLLASDTECASVLAELQVASKQITLAAKPDDDNPDGDPNYQSYINGLNALSIAPLRPIFQKNGVKFSESATLTTRVLDAAWEIVDPAPPTPLVGKYTIWEGYDTSGDQALLARPSMPLLQQLFNRNGITLRWQATLLAGSSADEWIVDNDSANPNNLQLGYMTYMAIKEADGSLSFYGTTLRIKQLGENEQEVIRIVNYGATILCKTDADKKQLCGVDGSGSYLAGHTICPNTRTLQTNQAQNMAWARMLWAPQLPLPPTCVPSPYADCPQRSVS